MSRPGCNRRAEVERARLSVLSYLISIGSRNKISGRSNVLEDQSGNITKADGSMKIPVRGVTSVRKAVGIAREQQLEPSDEG